MTLTAIYLDTTHWRIQGGDTCPPPGGPNSFIFMHVSAKNRLVHPLWELASRQENPGSSTATASL